MASAVMPEDKGLFVSGIQPSIWDDQSRYDNSWTQFRADAQLSHAVQSRELSLGPANQTKPQSNSFSMGPLTSNPLATPSVLSAPPGAIGPHPLQRPRISLGHTVPAPHSQLMMPLSGNQIATRHNSAPISSQLHGQVSRVPPSLAPKRAGRGISQSNIFSMRSPSMHSQHSTSSGGPGPLLSPSDLNISSQGSLINEEELIPTAIVIKNIPFATKKEQLMDVMTELEIPLPYAFNYHFDNGVFRGLAFANFSTSDETAMAISRLNDREIGGRKLRVEYKKMLPLQERERIEREKREKRGQLEEQHTHMSLQPPASAPGLSQPGLGSTHTQSNFKLRSPNGGAQGRSLKRGNSSNSISGLSDSTDNLRISAALILDLNDPDVLDIYTSLVMFSCDEHSSSLTMQANISPDSSDVVISLCQKLNLGFSWENGLLCIRKTPDLALRNEYPSPLFHGARVSREALD